MSKELEKHKSKGETPISRQAATVHPNDSASQVSSNILCEEGFEAGGDAAKRIAATKSKHIADKQYKTLTNSQALVNQSNSSKLGSSISRMSSRSGSGLKVEDITYLISSPAGNKSTTSTRSRALVPVNNSTLEAGTGSSVSKASSLKSRNKSSSGSAAARIPSGSSSNVSKASSMRQSDVSKASSGSPRRLTIEPSSSQKSKVSADGSAISLASIAWANESKISSSESFQAPNSLPPSGSKSYTAQSQIYRASSSKSNGKSVVSSTSRRSNRAADRSNTLVPATQDPVRVSPLRNELRAEDLEDDMYSISIHGRSPLQKLPNRAEMLKIILEENPHLEIDEATVIANNRIAASSAVGRLQVSGHIAPASEISRSGRSTASRTSSLKGKEVVRPTSVISAAPASRSNISKASSYYGKEVVKASVGSPTAPLTRSSRTSTLDSNTLMIPASSSSLTTSKIPERISEIGAADLLALAQLREQRDLRRAQVMKEFQDQHQPPDSDLARKRMMELEIAKQSLADTQLESQMQEFALQNTKLGDLMRHAHEDRVAALERAQMAESERKTSSMIEAMRDRTQMEKARNRERRGDIAKAERRREDERDIELQKEYERMDHDRTMETIDSFGRLTEVSRHRALPQPQRTEVSLAHSHNYRNPQTGGDGVLNMRIYKGCNGAGGDGECSKCGQDFTEHPLKSHSDGSVTTRSGKRLMPGTGGSGSSLSKASSSRQK